MNSENFEKYRKEFNDQLADPGAKKFLEQLGELDQIAHQTAENGYEDFDILEMKTDEVKSYAQEEGILGDKAMISGDIYPLELYEKLEQERIEGELFTIIGIDITNLDDEYCAVLELHKDDGHGAYEYGEFDNEILEITHMIKIRDVSDFMPVQPTITKIGEDITRDDIVNVDNVRRRLWAAETATEKVEFLDRVQVPVDELLMQYDENRLLEALDRMFYNDLNLGDGSYKINILQNNNEAIELTGYVKGLDFEIEDMKDGQMAMPMVQLSVMSDNEDEKYLQAKVPPCAIKSLESLRPKFDVEQALSSVAIGAIYPTNYDEDSLILAGSGDDWRYRAGENYSTPDSAINAEYSPDNDEVDVAPATSEAEVPELDTTAVLQGLYEGEASVYDRRLASQVARGCLEEIKKLTSKTYETEDEVLEAGKALYRQMQQLDIITGHDYGAGAVYVSGEGLSEYEHKPIVTTVDQTGLQGSGIMAFKHTSEFADACGAIVGSYFYAQESEYGFNLKLGITLRRASKLPKTDIQIPGADISINNDLSIDDISKVDIKMLNEEVAERMGMAGDLINKSKKLGNEPKDDMRDIYNQLMAVDSKSASTSPTMILDKSQVAKLLGETDDAKNEVCDILNKLLMDRMMLETGEDKQVISLMQIVCVTLKDNSELEVKAQYPDDSEQIIDIPFSDINRYAISQIL